MSHTEWACDCGRGPVAVFVGKTRTSLIVRRFRDVAHTGPWDGQCLDCVADAAAEIASYVRPSEGLTDGTRGPEDDGYDTEPIAERLSKAARDWDQRPEWTKPVIASPFFPRRADEKP